MVAGFTHDAHPARVVFGVDAHRTELLPELERLRARAILILASESQSEVAEELTLAMPGFRPRSLGFTRGKGAAERRSRARALAACEGVDCLVAVGSGAVIRAAAELAWQAAIPLIVLPTSYAGAEFDALMAASHGRGRTRRSARADPRVVIYDPTLTVGLPDHITGRSAMLALANGVGVLCTPEASPVAAMMAEEGIRQIADSALDAILHPRGLIGRSRTQYGGYLIASALAVTAPGPHRMAVTAVAQACRLRHSDLGTVLLPHLLAATGELRPLDLAHVAGAIGHNDAVRGVCELSGDLGAPQSLRELGMAPASLSSAIEAVRDNTAAVRDTGLDPDVLATLVENAYDGRNPGVPGPPGTSHTAHPTQEGW